jgi:Ethanolamine utilization protein EutJ (predicted chaperonin)
MSDTLTTGDVLDYSTMASTIQGLTSTGIIYTTGGTIGTSAGANGSYVITGNGNNSSNYWSSNVVPGQAGLTVKGAAEFEGDVKIKGVSISDTLAAIEKRLAILVPDPKKLEHFEALKKAYDHYKLLEKLCDLPTEENKE